MHETCFLALSEPNPLKNPKHIKAELLMLIVDYHELTLTKS